MAKNKRKPGRPREYDKKPVRFYLHFDSDLKERVKEEAKHRNTSPNRVVMEAVRYYLENPNVVDVAQNKPKETITEEDIIKLMKSINTIQRVGIFQEPKEGNPNSRTDQSAKLTQALNEWVKEDDPDDKYFLLRIFLEKWIRYESIYEINNELQKHTSLQKIIARIKLSIPDFEEEDEEDTKKDDVTDDVLIPLTRNIPRNIKKEVARKRDQKLREKYFPNDIKNEKKSNRGWQLSDLDEVKKLLAESVSTGDITTNTYQDRVTEILFIKNNILKGSKPKLFKSIHAIRETLMELGSYGLPTEELDRHLNTLGKLEFFIINRKK